MLKRCSPCGHVQEIHGMMGNTHAKNSDGRSSKYKTRVLQDSNVSAASNLLHVINVHKELKEHIYRLPVSQLFLYSSF